MTALLLLALGGGPALAEDGLSVLVGTRDATTQERTFEGPTAGLRWSSGVWELQGSAFVGVGERRFSELTQLIAQIGWAGSNVAFYAPEDRDRATLSILGSVGLGRDEAERPWQGTPRLVAGTELRIVERATITGVDDQGQAMEAERTQLIGIGPVVGVAFEARLGSPLRARASILDRTWYGPTYDYGVADGVSQRSRLHQDPTFTLDLSWSL